MKMKMKKTIYLFEFEWNIDIVSVTEFTVSRFQYTPMPPMTFDFLCCFSAWFGTRNIELTSVHKQRKYSTTFGYKLRIRNATLNVPRKEFYG